MAALGSGSRLKAAPVLSLFRSLLRLHREKLPGPMRMMGDTYLRDEFRKHLRGSTTEAQWQAFMSEWERYRVMLAGEADLIPAGTAVDGKEGINDIADRFHSSGAISIDALEGMSADQRAKLAQLREEAEKLGKGLFADRQ